MDAKDLLNGLFEFMGHSVVVPTGQEWEDEVMTPFLNQIISKQKEIKKKSVEQQIKGKSKLVKSTYIPFIQLSWEYGFSYIGEFLPQ